MRLLDAKEVAQILKISTQRVYELTRQGILPSVRIGARQIRFEEARLLDWIENGGGLSAPSVEDYKRDCNDVPASIKPRFSGARSGGEGGNPRQGERKVSSLRLDDLREFEPIRFVLECTLRAG
ncbi:MAG TPA: helix-turn-helix domain-containing protein [Pyrinomonadaceae bacterium]|nr:helix-turn-helix domain-containing protein [Pyrinomonadaceae bacterium]